jgi:chromate reductase
VLVDKPVVLWNASPRASHALAALRETLTVMSAKLIDAAALELLILSEPPGQAARNPDPVAMEQALLVLQAALRASSN